MAGKAAAMGSPRLIVFGRVALCAAEALSPGASVGRELVAEAGPETGTRPAKAMRPA